MYDYRLRSSIKNNCKRRKINKKGVTQWSMVLCLSLIIACGFVYVSWQHVESVNIGYETEQLNQQILALDKERRGLELERERQLSPKTLETRASEQGLVLPNPDQTIAMQSP